MRLREVETRHFNSIPRPAAVIAGSGWEPRATAILNHAWLDVATRKVLVFDDYENLPASGHNRAAFEEAGFEILPTPGSEESSATRVLTDILASDSQRLLVDISSMTRVWYAAMVRILRDADLQREVHVDFAYFPGVYPENAVQDTPNEVCEPVVGFSGLQLPSLPVALLLGLGLDIARADSLIHRIEPKRALAFLPIPNLADEPRTLRERFRLPVGELDFLRYRVQDPGATFRSFESAVLGFEDDYRVLTSSLGPKLFSLLTFLAACVRPRLSVWRVSSGRHQMPVMVSSRTRDPVICSTRWVPGKFR